MVQLLTAAEAAAAAAAAAGAATVAGDDTVGSVGVASLDADLVSLPAVTVTEVSDASAEVVQYLLSTHADASSANEVRFVVY